MIWETALPDSLREPTSADSVMRLTRSDTFAAMDESTREYYERHGHELAGQYASIRSPLRKFFSLSFTPGARILDIGAGIGRELAALLEDGYDAYGVEPSEALRSAAAHHFPLACSRLAAGAIPIDTDDPAVRTPFDGILCSAVLHHFTRPELFGAVFSIKALLRARGRLLISIPLLRDDVKGSRDFHGRLFNGVTPDELELLFERAGFRSIGRWVEGDALERGHSWATILLELYSAGSSRPIDHIEAVLSTRERRSQPTSSH
jgi:SAM-dependent methyltransferase